MTSDSRVPEHPVKSVAAVEALTGAEVIGEIPEVFWEDSHGHFQFVTKEEVEAAVADPYCQQFLPAVDFFPAHGARVRTEVSVC